MSGQGADATVVPWPPNYDVVDVPPADFTPEALPDQHSGVFNDAAKSIQLPLYWATGKAIKSVVLGNDQNHSYWYESSGRRKQMYWSDGSPASAYWPDGTQIPLYGPWGYAVTDDVNDPEWTPPPPDDEDPEDPEDPGGQDPGVLDPLVSPATLQSFTPDDQLSDELAALAVESASALVDAYTRGRHLDRHGNPRPGITTVVLTVAARIGANPGQVSRQDQAGNFSSRRGAGFAGFTLAEQAVLNRYRKRAIGP